MSLKKDKQKVLGEVFDDDRVRGFLDINELEGQNTEFRLLERAYRSMNIDNFTTFLNFFKEAGHNIDATNNNQQSLHHIITQHPQSNAYLNALESFGAKAN